MFDLFFWRKPLRPLPYSREIHCHLIPGVDDGSPNIDFTMKALKALDNFGVEKVIFTPHYTPPRFDNYPEKIQPIFNMVKLRVEKEDLDLVCENFSFEYRVDQPFADMVEASRTGDQSMAIRPLNFDWLLIENGWRHPYPDLLPLIEKLQDDGYRIILAHPERYGYYASNHGAFYHQLQEMGVRFQCNMLSFTGYYGELEKNMAYWMLKKGYVNFLGSDMHNPEHLSLLEDFLRSSRYAEIEDDLVDMISNDHMRPRKKEENK